MGSYFSDRDQTHIPCIARWILKHWTTREAPVLSFLLVLFECLQKPCRIATIMLITQVKKLDSETLKTFSLLRQERLRGKLEDQEGR